MKPSTSTAAIVIMVKTGRLMAMAERFIGFTALSGRAARSASLGHRHHLAFVRLGPGRQHHVVVGGDALAHQQRAVGAPPRVRCWRTASLPSRTTSTWFCEPGAQHGVRERAAPVIAAPPLQAGAHHRAGDQQGRARLAPSLLIGGLDRQALGGRSRGRAPRR